MAAALPKVTEYVKNVGKSVGYSTIDYFKGTMEESSDFIETNQELFKSIVSATRNYKRTLAAADRSIRKTKVYEAGTELKKTLFESIRTGKFYDMDRENYYSDKAAGSLADMGEMGGDDWSFNSGEFDVPEGDGGDDVDMDFEDSGEFKSSKIVAGAVQDAATAQAKVFAQGAEYMAEVDKAGTRLLFTQGERMYSAVNSAMANMQAMLDKTSKYLEGPLNTHLENSTTFYKDTSDRLGRIEAYLKEFTEIQRNLYRREQREEKRSALSEVGVGMPDLEEYGKQVWKNIKSAVPPELLLLLGDENDDTNMLMAMVANPLKMIPDFIIKTIVPNTVKAALEGLDKTVSNVFAQFIGRMNNIANDESLPEGFRMIGRILGLKGDPKKTVSPGAYEKGAVPFDGVTRKSIVDVIPGYLARIEAALTGKSERVFDYGEGKFHTADEVYKKFQERKKSDITSSTYDAAAPVRDKIRDLDRNGFKDEAIQLQQALDAIMKKVYKDNGVFEPNRKHGVGEDAETPWDYYMGGDLSNKDLFYKIADMMMGITVDPVTGKRVQDPKKARAVFGMASSVMDQKEYAARRLRETEKLSQDASRVLFNGSYDFNMRGEEVDKSKTSRSYNGLIIDSRDKYRMNTLDYLRAIYAETKAIRTNGGIGGSGIPTPNGPNAPTLVLPNGNPIRLPAPPPAPVDPLKEMNEAFENEEAIRKARANAGRPTNPEEQKTLEEYEAQRAIEDAIEKARKEAEEKNRKPGDKFINDLINNSKSKFAQRVGKWTKGVRDIAEAPGKAFANVVMTADQRIRDFFFGKDSYRDDEESEDGRRKLLGDPKAFMTKMLDRMGETFDKFDDWLNESILEPIKKKLGVESLGDFFKKLGVKLGLDKAVKKVKEYAEPVKEKLKEKLTYGWDSFKGSMDRTFGAAGRWAADKLSDAGAEFMASGGMVTKRGLAVLSPGERVIPVGGKQTQRNNLTEEIAFARRNGIKRATLYAGGTDNPVEVDEQLKPHWVEFAQSAIEDPGLLDHIRADSKFGKFVYDYIDKHKNDGKSNSDDQDKVAANDERILSETSRKIIRETVQDKGMANVVASGLLGSGVSILTGAIGGPLLGAAVGSAFGMLQNSKTFSELVFGKEVVDENGNKSKQGGLISDKVQKTFKKYFPSMKDFGLAGGVLGLFTPFGIVGGLALGSAVGFAKENEQFQEMLFGPKDEKGERNGGLIKKEYRDRLKKAAPRMLAGALGGVLLGPFGIIGNAALGSALGFGTTTSKFHEFIFGKEKNGKRYGGIVSKIKDGFVKPLVSFGKYLYEDGKYFFKKHVFSPLKDFGVAMRDVTLNTIQRTGHRIADFFGWMMERTIGRPLSEFLQHSVFDRLAKWTMRLVKAPINLAKFAIGAPAHMLGWVGNNIRAGQIARGTARGMTADQRLQFRKKHKGRTALNQFLGKDKALGFDNMLNNMQGKEGVEKMREMADEFDDFLDNTKIGSKAAKLINQLGEEITEYLENNYMEDERGIQMSLYFYVGAGAVKKLKKAIARGKCETIEDVPFAGKFKKIDPEHIEALKQIIAPYLDKINKAIAEKQAKNADRKTAMKALKKMSGGFIKNRHSIRDASRMLRDQIDSEEAKLAAEEAGEDTDDPQTKYTKEFHEKMVRKSDSIIEALWEINKTLGGRGNPNDPTPPDPSENIDTGDIPPIPDLPTPGKQGNGNSNSENGNGGNRGYEMGDAIIGDAKGAIKNMRDAVNTIEGEDGRIGLTDRDGKPLDSNAKRILRDRQESNMPDRLKEVADRIDETNQGLFGKFKGKLGGAIAKAGGFLGSIFSGLGNNGGTALGKALGIAGTVAKIGILGAGLGHLLGAWNETIWPAIKPFFENTIKPLFLKAFDGLKNWLFKNARGLHDFLFGNEANGTDGVFTKIGKFFTNPIESATNWLIEGWEKLYKYLIKPLWGKLELWMNSWLFPNLLKLIRKAINPFGGDWDDGADKMKTSSYADTELTEVTQQKVNDKGQALYIDANGNETTEATSVDSNGNVVANEKATTTVSGYKSTVSKGSGVISRTLNRLGMAYDTGSNATESKTCRDEANNRSFKILWGDGKADAITIGCVESEEFVRLPDGPNSTTIEYGYFCDNKGNQIKQNGYFGKVTGGIIGAIAGVKIAGLILGAVAGFGSIAAMIAAAPFVVGGIAIAGLAIVAGGMIGKAVGTQVGIRVYELQNGNYVSTVVMDRTSADAKALLAAFGWSDVTKSIDTWGQFSAADIKIDFKQTTQSSTLQKLFTGYSSTTTTSKYETNKDTSSSKVLNGMTYTYKKLNSSYSVNGYIGDFIYDGKTYAVFGNGAYLIPQQVLKNDMFENPNASAADIVARYKSVVTTFSDLGLNKATVLSGGSRKARNYKGMSASARHLYQNDDRIRNMRFGAETMGDAGCAPVAAANLLNKVGGKARPEDTLAATTDMATRYQTEDGGTTPDYFADLLGGSETSDKAKMMRDIASGKPTVLLGKSKGENGTPFGSNNHYITAMGMDKNGNVEVEDPDLPKEKYKYPARKLMNDTIMGVTTGLRRKLSGRGPTTSTTATADKKKLSTVTVKAATSSDKTTQSTDADPNNNTMVVSAIANKAHSIISSQEGSYTSVAKDDNGAVSVGKIQWHADRAKSLLQMIANKLGASQSIAILGQSFYDDIMGSSSWKKRTVSSDEKTKLEKFLGTQESMAVQDYAAISAVETDINTAKKKGIVDENALCYAADILNQYGSGSAFNKMVEYAAKIAGSTGAINLDAMHQGALQYSTKYKTRRTNVYNALKGSQLVGTDTSVSVAIGGGSSGSSSYSTTTTETSSSGGLSGLITSAFGSIFKSIYGEEMYNLLGGGSTDTTSTISYNSDGSISYGSGSANDYGTAGAPMQRELVNKMASIKNQIKYTLTGPQDPDKGYASCASTVAWAYNKALGYRPGDYSGGNYASSTSQSKDPNFETIWTNDGTTKLDHSILQPGDIMYYHWGRTKLGSDGAMQHTEMYAGNDTDLSHGGPNEGDLGPVDKALSDSRAKNLMMVRRYKEFMQGGKYASPATTSDSVTDTKLQSTRTDRRMYTGSGRRKLAGYARNVNNSLGQKTQDVIAKYGISTTSNTPKYAPSIQHENDAAYNAFLSVIIDLLAAIAGNTECLTQLQSSLQKKGIDVDTDTLETIAGNARKRQGRGREKAGMGPIQSTNYRSQFTQNDMDDLANSPTSYMVRAMEILASE